MSENKDAYKPVEKVNKTPENAWILKEKEKIDLESRIVETLRKLNGKLTKKEIMELFHKIEVTKWLDWLRNELEKEVKLGSKEIWEDVLKDLLDLIKEAKELTQKWIEELKIELNKLNTSKNYIIDKKVYLSSKFSWIKKLEDSELGKNIIIDISWIAVWLVDSAEAIFKILLGLIKDLIMLPTDLVKMNKKSK